MLMSEILANILSEQCLWIPFKLGIPQVFNLNFGEGDIEKYSINVRIKCIGENVISHFRLKVHLFIHYVLVLI